MYFKMRKLTTLLLLLIASVPFAQIKPDFVRTPNGPNIILDRNEKFNTLILPHYKPGVLPTWQDIIGKVYVSTDTTGRHLYSYYRKRLKSRVANSNEVAAYVSNISQLLSYRGIAKSIVVRDTVRGGIFSYSTKKINSLPNTNTAFLVAPPGISVTGSTTGGKLAAGTYYWTVTALTAAGETPKGADVTAILTGTTSSAAITWTAVAGATSYKIYRGTAAGAEGTYFTSATTSFTDIGGAGTAGTFPLIFSNLATIAVPSAPTLTGFRTGGTLPATTLYYKITAQTTNISTGIYSSETTGSTEVAVILTTNSSSVRISWPAVPGATFYRVYRGTSSGFESTYFTTGTNSFTDTGAPGTIDGGINFPAADNVGIWTRQYSGPVKGFWFGIVGDGVTDDADNLQLAINASVGKTLIINRGTFQFAHELNMRSNSTYIFFGATFIGGSSTVNYEFQTHSASNITINGGNFIYQAGVTTSVAAVTGTYSSCTSLQFTNCYNVNIGYTLATRMFTVVNLYNCTNVNIHGSHWTDVNAGLAWGTVGGFVGKSVAYNAHFYKNRIIRCGDDGISMGPANGTVANPGTVRNFIVENNYITKTTRGDGTLNGSTVAGTGIRIGNYSSISTTGRVTDGVVKNNIGIDMVQNFIGVFAADRVQISGNNVNGYAKNAAAIDAYGLGYPFTTYPPSTYIDFNHNTASKPYNAVRAIEVDYVNNSSISNNTASTNLAGDGVIRMDHCATNKVFNNRFYNTLGYDITTTATCTNTIIEDNDVTTNSGAPIVALGTGDVVRFNPGYNFHTIPGQSNRSVIYRSRYGLKRHSQLRRQHAH
jgi:hypothetical protein